MLSDERHHKNSSTSLLLFFAVAIVVVGVVVVAVVIVVLIKNFPFFLKSFCLGNKAGYDTLLSSHMQHFLANLMLLHPLYCVH